MSGEENNRKCSIGGRPTSLDDIFNDLDCDKINYSNYSGNQIEDPFIDSPLNLSGESNFLGISHKSPVITRKFALLPVSVGKRKMILSTDRKIIYGDLTKQFVKIRELKNIYSRIMLDFVKQGGDLSYFKSSSVKVYQDLYLHLNCNEIDAPQYSGLTLKERVRKCAFFESFQAVRNAIIKTENIKTIAGFLEESFALNNNGLRGFLSGKRFGGQDLKALRDLLKKNCFGERQPMSTHYLNDHILHLRNLYLGIHDFKASEMSDENPSRANKDILITHECELFHKSTGWPINPQQSRFDDGDNLFREKKSNFNFDRPPAPPISLTSPTSLLQSVLKRRIESLSQDNEDKNAFIDDVANGFTRKKKRRIITIKPGELPLYFLTRYISSVSRQCTKIARFFFISKERLLSTRNPDKRSKIQASLDHNQERISSLVGNIDLSSFTDFKRSLKNKLDPIKESLERQVNTISREQRKNLFLNSFRRELNEISSEPCQYVLKRIFKPSFSRIIIENVSFDSFVDYFQAKVRHEMRARGIYNFRSKYKWTQLRRNLSLCWDKYKKMNEEIVHLLNHFITSIAKYHGASTIKVEDLRWSKHSKKKDVGKFMAHWQVSWFFSQVQEAIKTRCIIHGIIFQKVNARNTSQACSRCGRLGSRTGKQFSCDCGMRLDSDLNAARNIARSQSITA